MRIADIEIPCYVLDDGRRVIVQRGVLKALNMAQGTGRVGEGDRLTKFVTGKSLNPFVGDELVEMIKNPIRFKVPDGGNKQRGCMPTAQYDIVLCNPPFNAQAAREALDRGELVRLLADVEVGRISPEQLESVLEHRDRDRWFRRLLATFLGRP